MELADVADSKSAGATRTGSSPVTGTKGIPNLIVGMPFCFLSDPRCILSDSECSLNEST